jgi:hypothetical protein
MNHTITGNGEFHYDDNGLIHRDDGPAIIYCGKFKYFYQHGKLYKDGKIVEFLQNMQFKINEFGEQLWYNDENKLNYKINIDGEYWYDNDGEWHNEFGPARILSNGTSFWCIHGKMHRLDGPAIEYADGSKDWAIDGKFLSCKDNEEFLRFIKLKALL